MRKGSAKTLLDHRRVHRQLGGDQDFKPVCRTTHLKAVAANRVQIPGV